ncbi:hypothetical protein MRX96_059372 [Rhipicephalus microplus]
MFWNLQDAEKTRNENMLCAAKTAFVLLYGLASDVYPPFGCSRLMTSSTFGHFTLVANCGIRRHALPNYVGEPQCREENQKLKNDNGVKDHKIQGLNEKICDLLQKNQRLMEVSNSMFEQRSDALHSSAANSQARLLALETEKMEATERLACALSELATLRA